MINKKAQMGLGFAIIVAIVLFMIGMINVNFIKDEVTRARGSSQMNCSDSTISDGSKLTCLLIDIVVPYFIIIVISTTGGLITARFTGAG